MTKVLLFILLSVGLTLSKRTTKSSSSTKSTTGKGWTHSHKSTKAKGWTYATKIVKFWPKKAYLSMGT